MASEKKLEYIRKWEKENIEKISIRFKKGTKKRIQATGQSINGFVVDAVERALEERTR